MTFIGRCRLARGKVLCWLSLHPWKDHFHKKTGYYIRKCQRQGCPAVKRGNLQARPGDVFAFQEKGLFAAIAKKITGIWR